MSLWDDNPRRGTSTGAARLGAALATVADRHRQPGDPDPCLTCGLRKGTLANMSGQTMIDAMNVLAGKHDAFCCHRGVKDDTAEPTHICANYLLAKRASSDELLAAIRSVVMPPNDLPENDPVGQYVIKWTAEVDPDGKMNAYQLARIWEKTGPHQIEGYHG